MIAQYDVLFTGQMVFALTALLGLASLGVKLFGRKPGDGPFVSQAEFHESKREIAHELETLRARFDHSFERVLHKLDENKTELLTAAEARGQALHDRINQLQAQVARLDERTK